MNSRRFLAMALVVTLVAIGLSVSTFRPSHAQFGPANVPGFFAAAQNAVVNAAIGSAGAVTNPASNFIVLVQGGPIYCNGSEQIIPQSTITLVANKTFQIEWNCLIEGLYAKTAVTAPGTLSPDQPGVPATLLYPVPGTEISLSTVVCNATACGNGGNGSLTDARPVGLFPGSGTPFNTTLFANLPVTNVSNGTVIFCADCAVATAPCTGASTGALAIRVNATWRCQ